MNRTMIIMVPSNMVGTVQKMMEVIASMGVARSSQGRNLPLGLRFLANILSIRAPIMGSLTASQMFQIASSAARTTVLTRRTLV